MFFLELVKIKINETEIKINEIKIINNRWNLKVIKIIFLVYLIL